jgi:hypothetical protein
MRRTTFLFGSGIAISLVVAVALANREGLLFASAVASSESRPALLDDAEWNRPETARAFGREFTRGTPEPALLRWLQANAFVIDPAARTARRRIKGLPCNEMIDIAWSVGSAGRIEAASATVREAGCL